MCLYMYVCMYACVYVLHSICTHNGCVCVCVCQELQVMGLPSVLDRHTRQLDTTRLLNTVHRLMQLHLSHLHSIEELRNRCTCVAGG